MGLRRACAPQPVVLPCLEWEPDGLAIEQQLPGRPQIDVDSFVPGVPEPGRVPHSDRYASDLHRAPHEVPLAGQHQLRSRVEHLHAQRGRAAQPEAEDVAPPEVFELHVRCQRAAEVADGDDVVPAPVELAQPARDAPSKVHSLPPWFVGL